MSSSRTQSDGQARQLRSCTTVEEGLAFGRRVGGGANPSESELFSRISDVAIGPDHRTYVLDMVESRVQVYDHTGKYLHRFGKAGRGPGELESPSSLAVAEDRVYILTRPRILHVFDTAGTHVRQWRLSDEHFPTLASPYSLFIHGGSLFFGLSYAAGGPFQPDPPLVGVLRFTAKGNLSSSFDTVTAERFRSGSYQNIPTLRRYVAAGPKYVAVADLWHSGMRFFTLSGRPILEFGGCLPEDPNAAGRPGNAPAGAVGGWKVSSDVSPLGNGRFARFVPYVEPEEGIAQLLEIVDVNGREAVGVKIAPEEDDNWRRFTGAAVRDSVVVFFNTFEGVVQWATLRLDGRGPTSPPG